MKYNPTLEAVKSFIEVKNTLEMLYNELKNLQAKTKSDEDVDKIKDVEKIKEEIRSRSRESPSMILDLGLASAISFILAKAELSNLKIVIDLVKSPKPPEHILKMKLQPTKLSYAFYAYIIFKFLEEHLKPKELATSLKESADNVDQLARYVEQYLEYLMTGMNSQIASKLLRSYLEQFKRLCEAEFPKSR